MAIKVKWRYSCSIFVCVFSSCCLLKLVDCVNLNDGNPSKDFTEHSITWPKIYHGRTKREITNSLDINTERGHISDLIVSIDLNGTERILELTLNHDLVGGSYFRKIQKNGSYYVHRPKLHELELCHYRGYVRDAPGSWAAVSTCRGLRGVVNDGRETFYLENGSDESTFVYSGRNLRPNKTQSCGFPQTDRLFRFKRDTDAIRGPYNANRQSRYVELLLVVDNDEYNALGDLKVVYQHCKDITNIINALFVPLNIFIALIGVVVWTEKNEIQLSTNGDNTLTNFLRYRKEYLVKEHPNDNAQLLTRVQFEGGVVGKALKGPICTFEFSGGIFMDHSSVVGLVATTVAHELGHNFGMEHDRPDCECPDDRCIMAPSSSALSPSHWSSCSLEFLAQAFEHGMDYCLRNKPTKLFDSPVCGNGFVEPGEQCDCGLLHRCNNPCCNATTCMLFSNASCATGECCDFETCKPKNAGTECRSAEHECDLPEYCTGESEYCPVDVFKLNGDSCSKGKAFCYQGKCRSHSDQCKLLWGPSGKNSDEQCYEKNIIGNMNGNCGYNRLNKTYIKCYSQNVYCGMVHCSHLNERLEFGMESVSILSHSFINNGGNISACRTAVVDLGLNEVDPGLAPDGAKCGEGKMCVNQKCMWVGDLIKMTPDACPNNCSGNGICNSKGHCHCDPGFAPPLCDYPGVGGSTDSGPASDPNLGRKVTVALYIIFLVITLLSILAFLFIYYTRHNVKIWWKKSPTRHTSTPWECKRQSPTRGASVLLPDSVGIVDVGIIRDRSPGPKATLLNEKQTAMVTPAKPKVNEYQNELFMKGKGFTIKPLKKPIEVTQNCVPKVTETTHEKSSSVMTPSYVKYEKVNSSVKESDTNVWKSEEGCLRVVPPPCPPTVQFFTPRTKSKATATGLKEHSNKVDAPGIQTHSSKPKISEPILEETTAKELLAEGSKLVPTRKAPDIPLNAEETEEGYDKELPPIPFQESKVRPLSSPVELLDEKKLLKELKENKEYPTLTKIASLMKSASINRSSSINEKNKTKIKPEIKKLKFDREKLKNIEISNPIPQIDATTATIDNITETTAIARTQSMREPTQSKPNLQTFGSMRVTNNSKRPSSIHVHSRPTSPPPRPPPPKSFPQDYSYDDCLNLLSEKSAPLAHIDEESPTSNIYAVIEDSPKPERKQGNIERKVRFNEDKYEETDNCEDSDSPSPEKKKSLNNAPSGSTESMGLLGEIVSEIQARNLDSIYSSGTLKRKKEKEKKMEMANSSSTYNGNLSSARSDAGSNSANCGYLISKNLNDSVNSEFNNSVVKSSSQPKPPMIFNDLSKKANAEETPKVNNVDVGTYKLSSSGILCNSDLLTKNYKGKMAERDVKNEFLTSRKTDAEPVQEISNGPSSTSPYVKSSFSRPSLLGAPALPKLTPLSITSNFRSISDKKLKEEGKNEKEISSKPAAKTLKPVTNLNLSGIGSTKGLANGKSDENLVSSVKPSTVKLNGIAQKATPLRKNSLQEREGKTTKGIGRPLPSPPKAESQQQQPSKPDVAMTTSLLLKNSKENLIDKTSSINQGKKPPTEKKPDFGGKSTARKTANHVASLQSKVEGIRNTNDLRKGISSNSSTKTAKPSGETKTNPR